MQIFKINLPTDLKQANIYIIGDTHIGDKYANLKLIQETVENIKNDPIGYAIINGDVVNNATRNSVSDVYSENLTPNQQIEVATKMLMPIKDRILVMTEGNHEKRTYKESGLYIILQVATRLNVIKSYTEWVYLLYVRLGQSVRRGKDSKNIRQICYAIYGKHGSGGGKKVGGKANRLEDMQLTVDADIYIHSHTHVPMSFKTGYHRVDFQNSSVTKVEKLFVNGNAFLDFGGYGEEYGYSPSSVSVPQIQLNGTVKQSRAVI